MNAGELLGHELILRAAWKRLEAWYRTQEWSPEPELTRFRLELPDRLASLGERLRSGAYRPQPFKLLPYPKSAEHVRHYTLASVDDQLAFAAFGVLLAPYVEYSLTNNAFGNRWYRGMKREVLDGHEPAWTDRPFSLDDPIFYLPYRRDYGLFRRVAAWTAAAMLNVDRAMLHTRPGASSPDEYPRGRLPEFVNSANWPPGRTEGHWARLDLRLAYPSVRLELLEEELRRICGEDHLWIIETPIETPNYPKNIMASLSRHDVRLEIVSRLATALRAVRYEAGPIRDEHWLPKVAGKEPRWLLPRTNTGHVGLPTGLAIAGLLFNVYMRPVDLAMAELRRRRGNAFAYMRFADDVILLGCTPEDVRAGIELLETYRPGASQDRNLLINVDKAKPRSWKEFLEQDEPRRLPTRTAEDLITKERLGPFVTYLVERMSEIAKDDPRFGDPARRHLVALHELIRLDLPDDEVKTETRLAFAANRISKAFLPNETGDAAQRDLDEIAESVRIAMRAAPQKFSMWRSAVRVAARRSMEPAATRRHSAAHLTALLAEIAHQSIAVDALPNVEDLRRSFLRAIFWREIASALADLRRVSEHGGGWPTRSWTFSALDEGAAEEVHQWMANLDQWAAVLYGTLGENIPDESWFWELDALALAELAAADPIRIAGGDVVGIDHMNQLDVPLPSHNLSLVQEILRKRGRSVSFAAWRQRTALSRLTALVIARVHVPQDRGSRLSRTLRALIRAGEKESRAATTIAAQELRSLSYLSRPKPAKVEPPPSVIAIQLAAQRRGLQLARIRSSSGKKRRMSLYELLWTVVERSGPTFVPGIAPSVELPVRLALRLFREAIVATATRNQFADHTRGQAPVTWLLLGDSRRVLDARLAQIWSDYTVPLKADARVEVELSERAKDWPVPPHPAFDLVIASGAKRGDDTDTAWALLLHFFVALTGDERWLDRLCSTWGFRIPLDESWTRRSAAPMPSEIWAHLDAIARHCLNTDGARAMVELEQLREVIDHYLDIAAGTYPVIDLAEFGWDRADVDLVLNGGPLDAPMGTGPLDKKPTPLGTNDLPSEVAIRLAQISTSTEWTQYLARFGVDGPGRTPRAERQKIMREVTSAFGEVEPLAIERGPVLLPEVSIPLEELPELERLARQSGRAVLCGMLWRAIPTVVRGSVGSPGASCVRFLVNEAKLLAPVVRRGDSRFPVLRTFTIRKPVPAVDEYGLCDAATSKTGVEWRMLRGRTWYRFVHERWGDFTVAICSDLTDPAPWRSFDGQVLHLFLVSYNRDVELFEQLTWVRAFELHANVVGVNHGKYGGSFVWSPKHDHGKEIARLRGRGLSLLAEVQLPVKTLAQHQIDGEQHARANATAVWQGRNRSRTEFKAPRPGFRHRRPG